MEEEILQKIYKLTNELASQQQSNQDLASGLTSQLSELKVFSRNCFVITEGMTFYFQSSPRLMPNI
jgi:hypothetical protein